MVKHIYFIILTTLLIFSCTTEAKYEYKDYGIDPGPPDPGFIHAKGNTLVIGKEETEILLSGINLENGACTQQELPTLDHNEADYIKINSMGMNVVRFCMYYGTFEDDANPYTYKQSGWDYLNQEILWATANGIYMILDMHFPQGGLQSNAEGFALWDNRQNQRRLTALWKEIAYRYRDEKTIAGFDLVNEPLVSESVNQWEDLVNEIIGQIREVDTSHLIIIEQIAGVGPDYEHSGDQDYINFIADDPVHNVMYDFHFYHPFEFTHQGSGTYPGTWGNDYLETVLNENLRFSSDNNVPANVGEFGLRWDLVPEADAVAWMNDMLDLFEQYSLHWTYWVYHGWYFGIYTDTTSLPYPGDENTVLTGIFEDHLLD